MKTALTIAGSDSGGGAGIQADLKAFSANGVYGMSVITAVTAQNTVEVRSVQNIDLQIIQDQIKAVFEDINVDVVKIGMLSTPEIVRTVGETLQKYDPKLIVLDPVMISKGGHHLLEDRAINQLKESVIPNVTLLTPNLPEAEVLTGLTITTEEEMKHAAIKLFELGPKNVLVKGGHLEGDANDLLYDGQQFHWFTSERIETIHTHGTGCTLSSAIAANLAKGYSMKQAIEEGKKYISEAIRQSLSIGNGHGPTHHFHPFYPNKQQGVLQHEK